MPSLTKIAAACSLCVVASLVVGAGPTSAQTPSPTPTPTGTVAPTPTPTPTPPPQTGVVTLRSSRSVLTYRQAVTLSGSIDPAMQGETIAIMDEDGRTRATTTTDGRGRFSVKMHPPSNATLTARWLLAISRPLRIKVRPIVGVHIGRVLLFGRTPVSGRVAPRHANDRITVKLLRNSKVIRTQRVRLNRRSLFKTTFAIKKPGRYRTRAVFDDADHIAGTDRTVSRTTALPSLSIGSNGAYVKRLEQRLVELGYHLEGVDSSYDRRTYDAMIAFNKVQGRSRIGSVSESTWRALADPKIPRPRYKNPDFHIEVDQTKQVLYVVKDNRVTDILHVSTGAGAATRNGTFTFHREVNGTSGGGLYYPTYFDGLRAIHGWPEVPTYNASHGCVRVPMWAAKWIFDVVELGDTIRIYYS